MKLENILSAAALVATIAVPLSAEELKFANFTSPVHTVNASLIERLDSDLRDATGGELSVRGYHGGELGAGPVEQYVRAVQGVADFTWGLPGYTSSQFGKTMIVELPGVVPQGTSGADALCGAMDEILPEFPGTRPIALWTSEPNIMIMREQVVRTPADLEGLKIRVAGATAGKVAEAFGATPVQMPISQVYNALQTGLIDGVFTGSSTLNDFKLDEVATSFTLGAPLGRLSFYAVMGDSSYNRLSSDSQAALDNVDSCELGNNAEMAFNATADAGLARARTDENNTFVELNDAEIMAFADAVSAVVDEYVASVKGADALLVMQGNAN